MRLWTARKTGDGFNVSSEQNVPAKFAFIGVRACEINAIVIQDKVFCNGPYPDVDYEMRRRDAFIVAVNCGQAGGTCFCVSMGTGPKADAGFDLALTEFVNADRHEFLGRGRQHSRRRNAQAGAASGSIPSRQRSRRRRRRAHHKPDGP